MYHLSALSELPADPSESNPHQDLTTPKEVLKRNAQPGDVNNIQQGIQMSITANFQVLQQKLRRELMFRGYRVSTECLELCFYSISQDGGHISSRILRSQG